jgi:hypothetical protein
LTSSFDPAAKHCAEAPQKYMCTLGYFEIALLLHDDRVLD